MIPKQIEVMFEQIMAARPQRVWTRSTRKGGFIRAGREKAGIDAPEAHYTAAQNAKTILSANFFIRCWDAQKQQIHTILWNPNAKCYGVGSGHATNPHRCSKGHTEERTKVRHLFANINDAVAYFDTL